MLTDDSQKPLMYIYSPTASLNADILHSRYFLGRLSLMRQEGPESSSQFAGLHKDDGCLFTFSNPVSTYVTIDTTGMSNNSVV